jgi:hypothetical protein
MTRGPADSMALANALEYARRGWPVFPCRPGHKEPDTPHGFKDATIDPERITAWWTTVPDRNVAIATGAPGPDVLDVDVRPGGSGYQALHRLSHAGLLKIPVAAVATPSGGMHLYYRGTEQASGRLPSCYVDFKAAGGYILAPPSVVGGAPYRRIRDPHGLIGQAGQGRLDWVAALALLEPRQLHLRPERQAGRSDTARLVAWVARLPQGNRNAGLFWAACRVAESGQTGALAEAAQTAGLPAYEIARTIASARHTVDRGQPHPARLDRGEPRPEHESEAVI